MVWHEGQSDSRTRGEGLWRDPVTATCSICTACTKGLDRPPGRCALRPWTGFTYEARASSSYRQHAVVSHHSCHSTRVQASSFCGLNRTTSSDRDCQNAYDQYLRLLGYDIKHCSQVLNPYNYTGLHRRPCSKISLSVPKPGTVVVVLSVV